MIFKCGSWWHDQQHVLNGGYSQLWCHDPDKYGTKMLVRRQGVYPIGQFVGYLAYYIGLYDVLDGKYTILTRKINTELSSTKS